MGLRPEGRHIAPKESPALADKMKRRMDAEEGGGRAAYAHAAPSEIPNEFLAPRERANENSNFGLLSLSLSLSLLLSLH